MCIGESKLFITIHDSETIGDIYVFPGDGFSSDVLLFFLVFPFYILVYVRY